jgi:hypothetical protein
MRFIDGNTARTPAATTNSAAAATGFEPLAKASRTLVFTMCFHGVGVGAGDVAQLCDAWWSFFELWGPANNVAVAMVTGDGGKIDPTRAPHWAKVYYSHAFLQDAAPGGKYDLVVFTDSDSAFRYRTWDIVQYSNTKLKGQKLWLMPEDDFDYLSTGTMFMKNHDVTRKWLRAWYAETPQMYGRLALGNELAGHEGVWDPNNFKDPRPFLSTQRWENWWNGSPTVKESKGPANWLLAGAKEWRNNRVAATLKVAHCAMPEMMNSELRDEINKALLHEVSDSPPLISPLRLAACLFPWPHYMAEHRAVLLNPLNVPITLACAHRRRGRTTITGPHTRSPLRTTRLFS